MRYLISLFWLLALFVNDVVAQVTSYPTLASPVVTYTGRRVYAFPRDGVKGVWKFEETSGNRADSVGPYTLQETGGTVNSTTGMSGNGVNIVRANAAFLQSVGDGFIVPSDTTVSMVCWVRLTGTDPAAPEPLFGRKDNSAGSDWGIDVMASSGGGVMWTTWAVSNYCGGVVSPTTLSRSGGFSMIAAGWDKGAGKSWISINNETPTYGGSCPSNVRGGRKLTVGGQLASGDAVTGVIDECAVWLRTLSWGGTNSELANMWAAAAGTFYEPQGQ